MDGIVLTAICLGGAQTLRVYSVQTFGLNNWTISCSELLSEH